MDRLRTLLQHLGAHGAARNAELAVQARREQEYAVDALAARFAEPAVQAA